MFSSIGDLIQASARKCVCSRFINPRCFNISRSIGDSRCHWCLTLYGWVVIKRLVRLCSVSVLSRYTFCPINSWYSTHTSNSVSLSLISTRGAYIGWSSCMYHIDITVNFTVKEIWQSVWRNNQIITFVIPLQASYTIYLDKVLWFWILGRMRQGYTSATIANTRSSRSIMIMKPSTPPMVSVLHIRLTDTDSPLLAVASVTIEVAQDCVL